MRSVNHVASRSKRKRFMKKYARGYWGRKKNVWTVAKNQIEKSLGYAYVGRKLKKRDFRRLWIVRINAGVRMHGLNYSNFISKLKKANVVLNRKVLADMATNHPASFEAIVKIAKSA